MISLLRVAAVLAPASAYSSVMLGTSGCSRSLSAGTSIMGDSAVSSSDRTVSFDDHTCGGTYTSGDELTARISDTGNQFVFEVSGGVFEDGDCGGGNRVTSDGETVLAPTDGSDIVLWAGWASGYGAVSITATCMRGALEVLAPPPS